ncbi:MAG: malate dehydrogenase [Candidatus Omnitrophica bacterium]|nr:malate dehydrogenase [Candidatus Omnitrophota bacterium]
MPFPKVTVVGAGFVGATTAQRIVEKDLADVVLIDVVEGLSQGKALDMMQSAPVEGFHSSIRGTNDYKDTAGSDLIIITAGLTRKPGMSRDDLLLKNAEIVGGIAERAASHSPKAVILVVTNPLDVMCYVAWKKSGFPVKRIVGMAGVLDSARYSYFIAKELGCGMNEVQAVVLGGHGDAMVPLPRYTKVRNKPLSDCVDPAALKTIEQRTRDGGAEIVALLKTGSAFYAPSSSAVLMAKSILRNESAVFPSSVYLNGEYGLKDVFTGVPARLGEKGVEEIVELELTDEERKALNVSAEGVRENIRKLSLCIS